MRSSTVLECDNCRHQWPLTKYDAGDECPNNCAANPEDYYYALEDNLASYLVEVER
jgi:hypothetical protein